MPKNEIQFQVCVRVYIHIFLPFWSRLSFWGMCLISVSLYAVENPYKVPIENRDNARIKQLLAEEVPMTSRSYSGYNVLLGAVEKGDAETVLIIVNGLHADSHYRPMLDMVRDEEFGSHYHLYDLADTFAKKCVLLAWDMAGPITKSFYKGKFLHNFVYRYFPQEYRGSNPKNMKELNDLLKDFPILLMEAAYSIYKNGLNMEDSLPTYMINHMKSLTEGCTTS